MDYLDLIDAVQAVVDGVLFGATYALLGIGFTLVFGVMHKINLAYAAASIGAAYASLLVLAAFKAPAIVVFIVAAIAGGGIGALVYFIGFKLIPLANPLATLMSTVGLLLLIAMVAAVIVLAIELAVIWQTVLGAKWIIGFW